MENCTGVMLLGDVAKTLGCKPYQVVYLLTTRQVPEPALRLGNRRVFTAQDVGRIAAKLKGRGAGQASAPCLASPATRSQGVLIEPGE